MKVIVDHLTLILFILLVLVGVAMVICFIRDRLRERRPPPPDEPERKPVEDGERRRRLAEPKFNELEMRYGTLTHPVLRKLYADTALLQQTDFYWVDPRKPAKDAWQVEHFNPADLETVKEAWKAIRDEGFPFASDLFGNAYYVAWRTPPTEPMRVYFFNHDEGGREFVAASLESMLEWERLTGVEWDQLPDS